MITLFCQMDKAFTTGDSSVHFPDDGSIFRAYIAVCLYALASALTVILGGRHSYCLRIIAK